MQLPRKGPTNIYELNAPAFDIFTSLTPLINYFTLQVSNIWINIDARSFSLLLLFSGDVHKESEYDQKEGSRAM